MAEPYVIEGEQIIREGESRTPSVTFEDFATISTGGLEIFINGSTQTASYVSGSTVVSANTVTLPLISIPVGVGGLTIVAEVRVGANGQQWKTGLIFRCLKPGSQR